VRHGTVSNRSVATRNPYQDGICCTVGNHAQRAAKRCIRRIPYCNERHEPERHHTEGAQEQQQSLEPLVGVSEVVAERVARTPQIARFAACTEHVSMPACRAGSKPRRARFGARGGNRTHTTAGLSDFKEGPAPPCTTVGSTTSLIRLVSSVGRFSAQLPDMVIYCDRDRTGSAIDGADGARSHMTIRVLLP
jgi:hypothetical protein